MTKLSTFYQDLEAERKGRWVPYMLGVELLIGRSGTPEYDEMVRQLTESIRDKMRSMTMEENIAVILPALAKYVLLGWKNIEEDDGTPTVYSTAKALELLADPRLRDMRDFVLSNANSAARFRATQQEQTLGN